jgi:hypothetical protein
LHTPSHLSRDWTAATSQPLGSGSAACASAAWSRRPAGATARSGSGAPRLFGSMASKPEPDDMAHYFKNLDDRLAAEQRERKAWRLRMAVMIMCTIQSACAACFLATMTAMPDGFESGLLVMTVAVTAASGVVGVCGAFFRVGPALHWFVISQVWCLSNIISQCVRDRQSTRRQRIFCADAPDANSSCLMAVHDQQTGALLCGMLVAYGSVFLADGLAQSIQQALDYRDNHLLVQFVWLMQKRTLVSVSRFEETIHTQFEELINLGYLTLKS